MIDYDVQIFNLGSKTTVDLPTLRNFQVGHSQGIVAAAGAQPETWRSRPKAEVGVWFWGGTELPPHQLGGQNECNDLGPPFRGSAFRRSAIPGYYCYNNPNPILTLTRTLIVTRTQRPGTGTCRILTSNPHKFLPLPRSFQIRTELVTGYELIRR